MKKCYEKLWRDIKNVIIQDSNITIHKKDIKYRTDAGICFFIAELEFEIGDNDTDIITISLPDIKDNFMACENTLFVEKHLGNDTTDTVVKLRLKPGKLILTAYPFSAQAKYELNVQLFMCLTDKKFIAPNK